MAIMGPPLTLISIVKPLMHSCSVSIRRSRILAATVGLKGPWIALKAFAALGRRKACALGNLVRFYMVAELRLQGV